MFTLTIAVGNVSWPLVFKGEHDALAASNKLFAFASSDATEPALVVDDFGQIAIVRRKELHGWLVEDMEKVKLAHVERAIYANHMQIDAQSRANSDPKIRAARGGSGPGIVTPFGGNGVRPLS